MDFIIVSRDLEPENPTVKLSYCGNIYVFCEVMVARTRLYNLTKDYNPMKET
jgi:hypothetical protein